MSEPTIYQTSATATGEGRNGRSRSVDGILDVALATPKELGGAGGATEPVPGQIDQGGVEQGGVEQGRVGVPADPVPGTVTGEPGDLDQPVPPNVAELAVRPVEQVREQPVGGRGSRTYPVGEHYRGPPV